MPDAAPPERPHVELRLPADRAFAAVLRTTTAALAARLDFTVDDIEDLRIAVGEVTAMLLEQADPGGDLVAGFRLGEREVSLTVSTDCAEPAPVDQEGYAWQVLAALSTDLRSEVGPSSVSITLALRSAPID